MNKWLFRLIMIPLMIVGPLIIALPYIVDWFTEVVTDFYPLAWKALKKGEKV